MIVILITHLENVLGNVAAIAVGLAERVPADFDGVIANGETAGRRGRVGDAGLRHEPLYRTDRLPAGVTRGELEGVVATGLQLGVLRTRERKGQPLTGVFSRRREA